MLGAEMLLNLAKSAIPIVMATSVSSFAKEATHSDLTRGEKEYMRCIGCHSFEYNRTGPMHCGLFGRRAGGVDGFDYSEAMRKADIVWNEETLDEFIKSPLTYVPGTSMGFVGISDQTQRAALLGYLKAKVNTCAQLKSK